MRGRLFTMIAVAMLGCAIAPSGGGIVDRDSHPRAPEPPLNRMPHSDSYSRGSVYARGPATPGTRARRRWKRRRRTRRSR